MAEMDARETALRGIEDRLVELALARADVETVTVLVGDTLSGSESPWTRSGWARAPCIPRSTRSR